MFVLFERNGLMVVPDRGFLRGIDFLDSLGDHEPQVVLFLDEGVIRSKFDFQDKAVRFIQGRKGSVEVSFFPGQPSILIGIQGFLEDNQRTDLLNILFKFFWPRAVLSEKRFFVCPDFFVFKRALQLFGQDWL